MGDADVYDALDMALLYYSGEDFLLKNFSKGAQRWFPDLQIGQTLEESFPNTSLRRVLRKIGRKQKSNFVVQSSNDKPIEMHIKPIDEGFLLHGFINHKLNETQVLLKTYSKEIEQQNTSLEESLAWSSRLSSAIEQSHIPSIFLNESYQISYLNNSAKELLQSYHSIFRIDPPFVGGSLEHVSQLSSIQIQDCPCALRFEQNGLYFQGSMSYVKNTSSVHHGFFIQLADATKEYEALSHSTSMRFLVEKMSLPCMNVNPTGNILYCNPSFFSLFQLHWPIIGPELDIFEPQDLLEKNICSIFIDIPSLDNYQNLPKEVWVYVGKLIFEVQIIPLLNHSGILIGYALEWKDGNAQRIYRDEVGRVFEAFQKGLIHVQPTTDTSSPFFAQILSEMEEIINSIRRPLINLQSHISALSKGILDQLIEEDYQGNLAFLKANWNNSMVKLSQMISNAVEKIIILEEELNRSHLLSQSIQRRREEQDRKLHGVRSILVQFAEEYRTKTRQIERSLGITEQSENDALHEESQIKQLQTKIAQMEEDIRKVALHMGIVEEMAFESHLLALNTAVEASRLGSEGKGFRIISQKMHSLAKRSREATEESRPIIETMLEHMKSGIHEINKTSKTLTSLSERAHQVHSILSEVVSLLNSQNIGFKEGVLAIEELEEESSANQFDILSLVSILTQSNSLLNDISEDLLSFKVYESSKEPKTISELREAVEHDPVVFLRVMKRILG